MKTENKKVLLDCVGQDIKKREFPLEQAKKIFAIQKKQQRNDWTLSEGQTNYQLKDGDLIESTSSSNPSGRDEKAGRTS